MALDDDPDELLDIDLGVLLLLFAQRVQEDRRYALNL